MDPDGTGAKEIANFDSLLVAVQEQMQLMALGIGNGTLEQWASPGGKRIRTPGGAEQEWPEEWPDKRQRLEKAWGSATSVGIWTAPEGILFGNTFIPYADHAGLTCMAQMAPSKELEHRHKWCTKGCASEDAHKRPAGIDDEIVKAPIPDSAVWTVHTAAATDGGARGGRGRGSTASKGKYPLVGWNPATSGGQKGGRGKGKGGKGGGKASAKGGGKAKGKGKGQKPFQGQ